MAIKISGNTVIDDSQNISVSGNATANSFVGDGSNLTNLPGGGNVTEATASGTLADGSKVIVNTDGTVSVVAQTETTGAGAGSETVFNSARTYTRSVVYDSTNQKIVIAYRDNANSDYGTAIVGTVSGTSISFGSPVTFGSAGAYDISITYDSTNSKVVIVWRDNPNNNYGTAIVGTVSGTSISFGSPVVFNSGGSNDPQIIYDPTSQKVVIAYKNNSNSDYGTAIVGTVSGTGISFGTPVVFESDGIYNPNMAYDSANQKVVIVYNDNANSYRGTAVVGTVSGTSISFGSPVVFASTASSWISSITYDPSNSKVVATYRDAGNSNYPTAAVGTVSGTGISFGTPVVFNSSTISYVSTTYNSSSNKIVFAYQDHGNSSYGTVITGTVSGTSINFGSPVVFNSANTAFIEVGFDSTNNKIVFAYQDKGNSDYGTASIFVESGLSIPQIGTAAVFETATTYFTSTAYDSTNQKVVISYNDQGNSQYGTAVVGTVSGTSINSGSPVVFNTARTDEISAAYDSTNSKVVISYQDGGNSGYGAAIVGTVSGTSISFGSSTVFESGGTGYIWSTYDSSNQKVVISYQGTSNYGKAVVGTVSGTSISFGTPATFNGTSTVLYTAITYDSTNGKVVIAYTDTGNNSYGKAVVGTVSGTSISFGSITEFAGTTSTDMSAAHDPINQKVVIAFRDQGMAGQYHGKAVVGTVSGTSISFGSITTFEYGAVYDTAALYDSAKQKIVIPYRDVDNSHYGTVVVGTISGTSISFGSPIVFESARSQYVSATYDSTNQKAVFSYADQGNSSYGTSVVFSPTTVVSNLTAENFIGISNGAYSDGQTATVQLIGSVDDAQSSLTPGQKYYVQDDGTLAESGSVFAGTAVSSTSLVVKS